MMHEILTVISEYAGGKALIALYAAAFVLLLVREKNAVKRALLVYMPLGILLLFLLPPVYRLYMHIEEAATYYRLLWMLPMSVTVAYAAVSLLRGKRFYVGALAGMAAVIMTGSCVYGGRFMAPAENRLHIPQAAVDISDYLISLSEGSENVTIAVPGELIHFIRQYDTRLRLAYGREVYVAGWSDHNAVYEEMEQKEKIDAAGLAGAAKEYRCNFLVINAARPMEGDLREEGYELLALLDGYFIYQDPAMPFQY